MIDPVWEKNCQAGRYNRYPHDHIVSFVLSRFGSVPDRKAVRILDLGCGGGNNTRFLCMEGFDTYAVDGAPTAIELTRQYIADCENPDKIVLADFAHLDYPDNFFDCVIDRQSLGHNPAHVLDAIIAEVWRVLKSGGCYFGSMFSANHPHRCFGKFADDEGDMRDFERGGFTESGLTHFFTVEEIMTRFNAFDIEDIAIMFPYPCFFISSVTFLI